MTVCFVSLGFKPICIKYRLFTGVEQGFFHRKYRGRKVAKYTDYMNLVVVNMITIRMIHSIVLKFNVVRKNEIPYFNVVYMTLA